MPKNPVPEQYNGYRYKDKASGVHFLVDRSQLRRINGPAIFDRVFRNWDGVNESDQLEQWESGDPLPDFAVMQKDEAGKVYLIDEMIDPDDPRKRRRVKIRRHVQGPTVMDKYNFRYPEHTTPTVVLNEIKEALPIG